MTSHAGFETAEDALTFIKGGKAVFTITSEKTDKHFTFKVNQKDKGEGEEVNLTPFFVSVLNGSDNRKNYQYIGYIQADGESCLLAGAKGKPDAPSFKAFSWAWAHLNRGAIPQDLTIQHEGKCCRCSKRLTVPSSIASGIGPTCASGGY